MQHTIKYIECLDYRLLDEFGEGFGVAQAFSYVDPQMLTYMALEERLAQAMEVGNVIFTTGITIIVRKHNLSFLSTV